MSSTASKRSILGQLHLASTAITNAQSNPLIATALHSYGYTPERFATGQSLLDTALECFRQQQNQASQVRTMKSAVITARKTLNDTYSAHIKLARVALAEQPGMLAILQLNGSRHESQLRWIEQAEAFYTHSLARTDILELLATYGITLAHIHDGMAKVTALRQAIAKHQDQMGIAKESTSTCIQARKQLQKWFTPFIKITRVALVERPQLLSSLGISTPA